MPFPMNQCSNVKPAAAELLLRPRLAAFWLEELIPAQLGSKGIQI